MLCEYGHRNIQSKDSMIGGYECSKVRTSNALPRVGYYKLAPCAGLGFYFLSTSYLKDKE